MRRLLAVFLCLILAHCTPAKNMLVIRTETESPQKAVAPKTPSSAITITPEYLQQVSLEAREFLKTIPLKEHRCFVHKSGKKQMILGREVALAFLDPASSNIYYSKIGVCFAHPAETLIVLHDGLSVSWLRGKGITRFAFSGTPRDQPEQKLILLDACHWMYEIKAVECYFPYTDDFLFTELVTEGTNFFLRQIRQAQEELCRLNIRSRAFPQKKLCEVFPDDFLLNTALNEQIDEDEFLKTCPNNLTLPARNQIFTNCAEYSVYKTLIHYARNQEKAFRFVGSRAGAIGPMQFTKRTHLEITRRDCPEARLIPDFEIGARNLQNSIRAALCLLDRELANMPPEIKELYKTNYRIGGLYPNLAYNGGLNRALCFFAGKRTGRCRASRRAWGETLGYATKYQGMWYIIDNLIVPSDNSSPRQNKRGYFYLPAE